MARKKKNREINVFSASAIDLFASSMGVFIILVVVLFPYFGNKSKKEPTTPDLDLTQKVIELQKQIETQSKEVIKFQEIVEEKETKIVELRKQIQTPNPLQEIVQEKTRKIVELEKKLKKTQKKVDTPNPLKDVVEEKDQEIKELEKIVKELKKENKIIPNVAKVEDENKELKKIIKELKKKTKTVTTIAKVENENEELKKKIQQLQQQQSRQVASVNTEADQLKKEVLEVKNTMQKLKNELAATASNYESAQQQLNMTKTQMADMKRNSAKMKQELEDQRGREDTKSFLAVILKWSTQKHDVDLVIKDSNGKTFDYKHKKHRGAAGEFVLDSRSGPGAEVWQSQQLSPGRYSLQATLYNTYGNDKPAKVSASIFTKKGKKEVPNFTLDQNKNSKKINFTVDENGDVKL